MFDMIRIKLNSNRDIMELPTSERAELLVKFWSTIDGGMSKKQYYDWLNHNGWDTTNYDSRIFDADWEVAANMDPEEDEEEAPIDGISTVEEARRWLQDMTAEYGNTYFFPDAEKSKLNRLIERFGNTYFWNR